MAKDLREFLDRLNREYPQGIITVKEEKILDLISRIIRSKNNYISLIKFSRFIITGKAKIKGSYLAAIKLVRCLMIGNHEVYSTKK